LPLALASSNLFFLCILLLFLLFDLVCMVSVIARLFLLSCIAVSAGTSAAIANHTSQHLRRRLAAAVIVLVVCIIVPPRRPEILERLALLGKWRNGRKDVSEMYIRECI
jgi:hypothetical protein